RPEPFHLGVNSRRKRACPRSVPPGVRAGCEQSTRPSGQSSASHILQRSSVDYARRTLRRGVRVASCTGRNSGIRNTCRSGTPAASCGSAGRPGQHWLTNSGTSSARLYWENNASNFNAVDVAIPAAVTVFRGAIPCAPRTWVERSYRKLIYFHKVEKGGPF